MSDFKICAKCGELLPATEEHFYKAEGNKNGLAGSCKKCKLKQTHANNAERKKNKEHLIHELDCEWCGGSFKGDKKGRRFCSRRCQYEWQRGSEEYKNFMRNNGGHSKSLKERESEFKKQFEALHPRFRYHSGYEGSAGFFNSQCKACGHIQKRTAQAGRPSSEGVEIICENCLECEKSRKLFIKAIKSRIEQKKENHKRNVQPEIEALSRMANKHRFFLECEECGRGYFSATKKHTCSKACSRKRLNRRKELRRRGILRDGEDVDATITLDKLVIRDSYNCYICNGRVDYEDYHIRKDGTFIAGNYYPSIDHVKPISKGGTHTWDNIMLAHRVCNSRKGDRVYEEVRAEE